MSGYSPILIGESSKLRPSVEGVLSLNADPITDRLAELNAEAIAHGVGVTFGAEIEATFVPNPEAKRSTESNIDFYGEVARAFAGSNYNPDLMGWCKGAVIHPGPETGSIILNFGSEEPDQEGVIEIRTAPAEANVAVDRYWDAIRAVGRVAERHGHMGSFSQHI